MFDDYRHVVREHVFDKCWELDITWAEVERLLDTAEVIEEHLFDDMSVKHIRLMEWSRPLHMVYIVHHERRLVVFRTLYVPQLAHWHPGYRERRRRRDGLRDV